MIRSFFDWLRPSVGRKMGTILIVSGFSGSLALAVCYERLLGIRGDINYADLAGDQDIVADFMTETAVIVGDGHLQDRAELAGLIGRFDAAQRILERGGAYDGREVPPPPNYLRADLAAIGKQWSGLKPSLERMAALSTSPQEERWLSARVRSELELMREEMSAADDRFLDEGHRQRVLTRGFAGLAALAGFAAMLAGLFVLRCKIIGPLEEIEEAMRRFRDGDRNASVEPRTEDELGSLALSFNAMVSQVNRLDAQMKAVIDQSPSSIFLKDRESRFLLVNKGCAESFGLTVDKMIGLLSSEVMTPEALKISQASDLAAFESKEPITVEHEFPFPTGMRRTLLTKFPLLDADGTVYAIAGIATDVSAIHQAEYKLHESEMRHRALFDSSWDALMTSDPATGKFTSCNQATLKLFGAQSEAEFVATGPAKLSPERQPDGRLSSEKARELMERAVKEGHLSFEWTHKRLDGSVFPASVLLSRVEKDGRPFLQGTVRDITQRLKEEEAHRRLTAAIEHAGESIVITDAKGFIVYVNPAFEQSTGYSRAEAVGRNPRILKSGVQDEAFYKELWKTITSGRTWKGRLVNRRKDGVLRTEDATISPVLDAHGKIANYVAVKWDVTEKVEMETEFRHAQKMESVGRLAGGVAHDFNNILTAIIGYAQFLEADAAAGKAQTSDVKEILTAANRAASLTRQLLAFSRRQVLEPRRINLNAVVSNLQKMLERLIGENIKMSASLAPQLPSVMADPGQIEQVLMNLAVNARDAMPEGGTITIKTSEILMDQESSQAFYGAPTGFYTMISVGDTGVGMDEETKARVFEPFFTTKGTGKGTGLGLSMVYGIVKQSGGYINFESAPGKGTIFRIILPTVPDGDAPEQSAPDGPAASGLETILLVEDEAAVRGIALRALKEAGHTVLEASSGEEALRRAAAHEGAIDLLLSDVVMPGMDGWQLSERFAQLYPDTKILHMSGYTDKAALHRELEAPGANFLQKPFTPAGLVRKIRQVLDTPARNARPPSGTRTI